MTTTDDVRAGAAGAIDAIDLAAESLSREIGAEARTAPRLLAAIGVAVLLAVHHGPWWRSVLFAVIVAGAVVAERLGTAVLLARLEHTRTDDARWRAVVITAGTAPVVAAAWLLTERRLSSLDALSLFLLLTIVLAVRAVGSTGAWWHFHLAAVPATASMLAHFVWSYTDARPELVAGGILFYANLAFINRQAIAGARRSVRQRLDLDAQAARLATITEQLDRLNAAGAAPERGVLPADFPDHHDFLQALVRAEALAGRAGITYAVALFEIDRPPATEAEAAAVRTVAAVLRRQTRPTDLVAHLGGGRFGSVLVGASAPGAVRYAERIRRATTEAEPDDDHFRTITLSAGLAAARGETAGSGTAADDLVAAAEAAVERAVAAGGDRIEGHHHESERPAAPAEV